MVSKWVRFSVLPQQVEAPLPKHRSYLQETYLHCLECQNMFESALSFSNIDFPSVAWWDGAGSDQVGSTNVADLASWSGKRSGRSKRWKTGWDFRPRDPAGNRWNCMDVNNGHGTKWDQIGPRIQNFRKKRGKQLKYKMDKQKKSWLYFLRSFEFI